MKKIFTFISLLILSSSAIAQSPAWQWAISSGGTGSAQSVCVTHDSQGFVYVAGVFQGTMDIDPNPNVTQNITSAGYDDIFICKYDSNGVLFRVCSIGGPGDDEATSIAIDYNGNILIAGYFTDSIDVDPDTNYTHMLMPSGVTNSFILRINSYFNFDYVLQYNCTGTISINSILTDNTFNLNNTIICGTFSGTADLDPTIGTMNLTSPPSGGNGFVSILDTIGNFYFAYQFDATFSNATSLAVDSNQRIYVSGFFRDTIDLDPGPGVHLVVEDSTMNSFVTCLDHTYGNFIWGKSIGGTGEVWSYCSGVDLNSNVTIGGDFTGTIDIDPDSIASTNVTSSGSDDAFVVKLDSLGNFIWGGQIGGSGSDNCTSAMYNQLGELFLTGYFSNTGDLDPGAGIYPINSYGGKDIYLIKLSDANNFEWGKTVGGANDDYANDVFINHDGNPFLAGGYKSASMFFDTVTVSNVNASNDDLFLAKLTTCRALYALYPDTVPHNWFVLDQSSGTPPLTYLWNWGDSTTSTGSNPTHNYAAPGYYNICLSLTDNTGCTNSYCDSSTYIFRQSNENTIINLTVVQQLVLNTPENLPQVRASVFPNPANNKLTILLPVAGNTEASILDLTGKEIYKVHSLLNTFDIDVSGLSAGIYLVHIANAQYEEVMKIVVRK